ncbi:MAG: lipopolysaccharide biosynthesis protein [Agathobacter sp.]
MNNSSILSNLIWRFAERCGAQIVQFLVSIVLARILAPEAYGTIALVMVFAQILQVFVDSGLANALIQKKDADDLDFSSVFYFNIIWCLILYIITYFLAVPIANFYGDESLVAITRVLCLIVIISGVKNVQQAYVSRTMQFKKFFFATLSGTLVSAAAGIAMAVMGFGVWALVAQKIINMAIDTLVLWIIVRWRPKRMFSWKRLKGLLSYGWKLLVSAVIDTLYENIRSLIIGKLYTEADLAYYNQGRQFPSLIISNINSSIDSVLLPSMSQEQDDTSRVRNMTRRSIKVSTYIMAPLMMGLAFAAPTIVELVLTEKWLPCVPFLQIFCISYMFYPIHTANLNAIKAMGRSDLFLRLEIIKKIVGVCFLLSSMWFGVLAIAISMLIGSVCNQIINSWPNRKLLDYKYFDQIKDILPSIILAVFMGVCVWGISYMPLPLALKLIVQIVLGAIIYLFGSKLTKNESYYYVIEIAKPLIKKLLRKK